MVHGLLPGMAAILVGGLGLGLIIMCQAELTSAIPFAGGKGAVAVSHDPINPGFSWHCMLGRSRCCSSCAGTTCHSSPNRGHA